MTAKVDSLKLSDVEFHALAKLRAGSPFKLYTEQYLFSTLCIERKKYWIGKLEVEEIRGDSIFS